MSKFTFAGLLGRGKSRAEGDGPEEDQDDAAMEDGEEEDAPPPEGEGEETDDAAMEDGEDDEAEGGDEDDDQAKMTKAEKAAFAKGRKAERQRVGAILSAKGVGPANFAQAAHLAVNTALSPKEAAGVLSLGVQGASLADRMRGQQRRIGAGGGGAAAQGPSTRDRMAARFQKGK
ncbi:MAG: hypothetical protein ACE37J_13885 [Pikeienuella sp.]|uniref:hypothetical protein n=1 Tax=Pikeienuella sp. TaxID=2831957 RepID=UPI00391DD6E7